MRIVGGKWAGRDLHSPGDRRVRPTAEEVRGPLLDWLEPRLRGATVLDLFAGTGALGLEALSRGARSVDFVETLPGSLHALKANVAALHVRDRTRIFRRDALPFAAALDAGAYDLAFADPPYRSRMLDRLIESWQATPFAGLLVVEHAADHVLPRGLHRFEHGDTVVTVHSVAATKKARPGGNRSAPRRGGKAAGDQD